MEGIPQPINIERLKGILSGAKAVMNKVESGSYETGNVDPRALTETHINEVIAEKGNSIRPAAPIPNNSPDVMYPNLSKSKMPEAIKQAMINNPIPQITSLPQTFTLNEVMDYEKDEKPLPPKYNSQKSRVIENTQAYSTQQFTPQGINPDMVRQIIREEMGSIVKEQMIEFFTNYFAKSLAEDTQKKLIQHLIKEGRLTVKKK